ncbi:MAG: hypothetical protein QN229_03445 [Desulfurococcaceae archaeon TW002]
MLFKRKISLTKILGSIHRLNEKELVELMKQGISELRDAGKATKLFFVISLVLEDNVSGHQKLAQILREVCKTECHNVNWVKYLSYFKPSFMPITLIRNLTNSSSNTIPENLLIELVKNFECEELKTLRNEGYLETQPSLIKHYINTVLNIRKCESLYPETLALLNDAILYDLVKHEEVIEILKNHNLRLVIKRKEGIYSGIEIYYNDTKIDIPNFNILGFLKFYQRLISQTK